MAFPKELSCSNTSVVIDRILINHEEKRLRSDALDITFTNLKLTHCAKKTIEIER